MTRVPRVSSEAAHDASRTHSARDANSSGAHVSRLLEVWRRLRCNRASTRSQLSQRAHEPRHRSPSALSCSPIESRDYSSTVVVSHNAAAEGLGLEGISAWRVRRAGPQLPPSHRQVPPCWTTRGTGHRPRLRAALIRPQVPGRLARVGRDNGASSRRQVRWQSTPGGCPTDLRGARVASR